MSWGQLGLAGEFKDRVDCVVGPYIFERKKNSRQDTASSLMDLQCFVEIPD